MKRAYLLALAIAIPSYAGATNKESVYSWGAWSQNIQPAAGPVARVIPSPVKAEFLQIALTATADVQTANVQAAANAAANAAAQAAANAAAQAAADAAAQAIADAQAAPPVIPTAPQLPSIVVISSDTPTTPINQF